MRLSGVLLPTLASLAAPKGAHGRKFGSTLPEPPSYRWTNAIVNPSLRSESGKTLMPQNNKTSKYIVDGSALPDIDFDVGESYAGLMPIARNGGYTNGTGDQLYFWLFPTDDEAGKDTITIWLNGGPYCSSLLGLLQENGPFLWLPGTERAIPNAWSWSRLTNMIWIEQPVGTGFTQGVPTATSEEQLAAEFLSFWKNLVDTFDLHGKKVYITGESYAGHYVPYIADAMFTANDTDYFDVQGTLLYAASIGQGAVERQVVAVPFMDQWPGIFTLSDSVAADFHARYESCGFRAYLEKYLAYPPPGPFPPVPLATDECQNLWFDAVYAMWDVSPCFDYYRITSACPYLSNVISSAGGGDSRGAWFNRTEVQRAINAPLQEWKSCRDGPLDELDTSAPSAWEVYPRVIERSRRSVLVNGALDFVIPEIGTRLVVQNMTWGGAQGFQSEPEDKFYVPYEDGFTFVAEPLSGYGEMGITHSERGLTWVKQWGAGHMAPQNTPSAAFRQLEFLLGRIDRLTQ
ncbi:carboxypeptidase cpdS [Microdochium trichocladiopsis]|uniref:Carboxypeptidase n=1 Tax=Microdochium trichocladiopsis TaxID=1682393 RepID=A0A9P9BIQ3_9PEZI|nr:carboxypeptidase cpdS [Microdochium trichocladiopsis]KAH7014580.1 carboxypeptidase cpdS [Microdochium trichocladiopsis]